MVEPTDLQQAGGLGEALHGVLLQGELACVAVLNTLPQRSPLHTLDLYRLKGTVNIFR